MESMKVLSQGSWVGTVVRYDRGFKFISRISSIGNSRKFHDRAQESVPKKIGKWIFD
jgi:hypothetical protein